MKAHTIRITAVIALVLTFQATALSATLLVPGTYPTIQAAIDAANPFGGDLVLVAPGTYYENINFNGKAITLKSMGGPDVTIINGGQSGSVVTFNSGEGRASILDGFTIFNGSGTYYPAYTFYTGGGIYCDHASPTIKNNIIKGNSVNGDGGGISCGYSPEVVIKNNIICLNEAMQGPPNFEGDGGGLLFFLSSPLIVNNLIYSNSVNCDGGGIACYSSTLTMKNCTIYGNSAQDCGGGLACDDSSYFTTIENSIFWNNNAQSQGKEIFIGSPGTTSTVNISYSDVQGGKPLVWVDSGCTLNWGSGMINANPLFVTAPPGKCFLSQIASGQGSNSPCVNTGDPSTSTSDINYPILTTRTDYMLDDGRVDMGFHYTPQNCARCGNVNFANLAATDVLFINNCPRGLTVTQNTPLTMTLNTAPMGPYSAPFALFAKFGEPGISALSPEPFSLGTSCFLKLRCSPL